MSKSKHSDKISKDVKAQATKIVRNLNLVADNKDQGRAITKGVQRGIEAFLRQQSEKARILDKKSKELAKLESSLTVAEPDEVEIRLPEKFRLVQWIPWGLLILSWLVFGLLHFIPIVLI